MTTRMTRRDALTTLAAVGSVLAAARLRGQRVRISGRQVPPEWETLYQTLRATMTAVEAVVDAAYDGSDPAGTLISAELSTASASRGSALASGYVASGAPLQASRYVSMGLPCVSLSIGYPRFDDNFEDSSVYQTYYATAAADLRAKGFSIIAKTGVIFPSSVPTVAAYVAGLTDEQITDRYAAHCATVASIVEPDLITLGAEPTNQASILGAAIGTPSAWAAFIGEAAAAVRAEAVPGVAITAGIGTWETDPTGFLDALGALTGAEEIDLFDLHLYPVVNNYFASLLTQADYCFETFGKRCIVGESWLYKAAASELGSDIGAALDIGDRNIYSFWEPLDRQFLVTLIKAARWKQMAAVSAFWSAQFFANVEYANVERLSSEDQLAAAATAQVAAIVAGTVTQLGSTYANY